MPRINRNIAWLGMSLLLAACGGDDTCNAADRNAAVYNIMTDWYYWYDQVPDVDPANYASPAELLADIRYLPLDRTFTYLTTVDEERAFLSNAAYIGFGFSSLIEGDRMFLREVFNGGPADDAGMQRGDEILSIDGVSVATLIANDQLDAALGPRQAGYEATFDVRHAGEATSEILTVAKAEVVTPVVDAVTTDLGANADTTYFFFRSFVDPAYDALDSAFSSMQDAGDTRLVLDLRYNGGGLVAVAEHLGGLIAGETASGEVVAKLDFNARHQASNAAYLIRELTNTVAVTDLVVITTRSTASASEMIINGLQPHMRVATIGDDTYGKPVGQSRFEFCDEEILRAVTFKVVNSEEQGEYFDGIPPTCEAEDDITHPLGSSDEASLAGALHYLENGQCDPVASTKAARAMAKRDAVQPAEDPLLRDGWDVLTGGAQ